MIIKFIVTDKISILFLKVLLSVLNFNVICWHQFKIELISNNSLNIINFCCSCLHHLLLISFQVSLVSMQKYQPRIHIEEIQDGSSKTGNQYVTSFPQIAFIAVTAYQNQEVFYSITVMCLRFRTPKIINFPSVPNGKLIILGVPKFMHITTYL